MKNISSLTNTDIKAIAQLDDQRERAQQDRFVVEGKRALATYLHTGHTPVMVYATQRMLATARDMVSEDTITLVSDPVMNKISHATTPSGLLALFPLPVPPSPDKLGPGLVLAGIADPGNMGTLIRTAAALNYNAIVTIDGVDAWNPKVVQASAGALAQVTIFNWSWQEFIKHKGKLSLCALVVRGGKQPQEINFSSTLLVVGSEAHGIDPQWLADCNQQLTIPMPGGIESFNAAVAGSIALYLAWQAQNC